jgi:hypothetical protein
VKRLQFSRETAVRFDTRCSAADTLWMRTRIVFALAIATTLASTALLAAEWVSLTKTSGDRPREIFIDMSSIVLKDDIRNAQTKYVALLPWRDNAQPFNGAAFGIQRTSFNCNAGLVQVGGVELHSADGGSMGFIDVEQSWKPVDDPLTKKILDIVCTFKNPRPDETHTE